MGRLLLLLLPPPARLSGDTEERTRADGEAERTRGRTVFGGNVRFRRERFAATDLNSKQSEQLGWKFNKTSQQRCFQFKKKTL